MLLAAKTVKRDWCFDPSFVRQMSVGLLLVKLVCLVFVYLVVVVN